MVGGEDLAHAGVRGVPWAAPEIVRPTVGFSSARSTRRGAETVRRNIVASVWFVAIGAMSCPAAAQDRLTLDQLADREALSHVDQFPWRAACDGAGAGFHCFAKIRTDENGYVQKYASPQGYGPAQLEAAYKLPSTGGAGKIVAVIDAFHYANAESDLATYRSTFGLPPCTTANGCFKQVAADGTTNFGKADPMGCAGWAGEAALDLQMASAACPDCHILIVEASSDMVDFSPALETAVKLGAAAISNSYGGPEDSTIVALEAAYTHPGVLVTASAGDSGYGASYPATSAGVLAVGGTTLKQSTSSRGWAESAWRSGGSGCSSIISKPSWQTDMGCTKRMEADVAAVGDPNTGVATYCGGWQVAGGTSASSPIVAGAFTVLGVSPDPSYPWKNSENFFDVVSGSNGTCSVSYECKAGTGYDGPTGWGTPNGALLQTTTGSSSGGGSSGSSSSSSSGGSSGPSSSSSSSGGKADAGGTASSSGGSSSSASSGGGGSTSSGSSGGGSASSSGSISSSSGSSGSSSKGSSSSDSGRSGSGGAPEAGAEGGGSPAGLADNAGGNSGSQQAGCGCAVIGAGEKDFAALAIGLGLAAGLAARRRRR
jgi:hypothetical protein